MSQSPQASGRIQLHPLASADPVLAALVSHGQINHVTSGTRSSYGTAARAYVRFCETRDLSPFPVDEVLLAGFIHIIVQRIQTTSLGMYLAGIRYAHENEYGPWLLEGNELIRRTKRYVKRKFPSTLVQQKLPISLTLLRQLLPQLQGWPNPYLLSQDDFTFVVGSLIAVAQFLRGGEAFTKAKSDRKLLRRSMLNIKHINIQGAPVRSLVTSIPQPKTAWDVQYVDVPCFSCPEAGPFDPVHLWEVYCMRFPAAGNAPAFLMSDGSAATRDFMVRRTIGLMAMADIPSVDSAGKPVSVRAASWRAGAVRSAIDAGLSEALIMEYGRWRSTAWKHYLIMTPLDLLGASKRMVSASMAATTSAQQVGAEIVAQLGARSDAQAKRRLDIMLARRLMAARPMAHSAAAAAAAKAAARAGRP
jgi:hypothetical protein